MTIPAYSHTYTYNRVGIGDVIALDPAGAPYTGSTVTPSGWAANYWYATDRLASVRAKAKWTQTNIALIPANATQLLVNVTSAPRTANSDRLKVTIGSSNYKAATGLRYTSSGSHKTTFAAGIPFPVPANLMHWFDFTDASSLWKDEAGTDPVTTDGDVIARIDNKGTSSANLTNDVAGERPLYKVNITGEQSVGRFDGVNDVLRNLSVPEDRASGDIIIALTWLHRDNQSLDANDVMWSWDDTVTTTRLEVPSGVAVQNILVDDGITPINSIDHGGSPAGDLPIDTLIATIGEETGGNSHQSHWSWLTGSSFHGVVSIGPAADQILAIGNKNDGGANHTEIDVLELAIWIEGSGPTIDDIKNYQALKNGVVWTP